MTRLDWVAYDIGDDRERRRVERCLARRGQRLQKSLFACVLDEARLRALQADLQALPLRTGQVVLAPQWRAGRLFPGLIVQKPGQVLRRDAQQTGRLGFVAARIRHRPAPVVRAGRGHPVALAEECV
jgi:hypothetical protein